MRLAEVSDDADRSMERFMALADRRRDGALNMTAFNIMGAAVAAEPETLAISPGAPVMLGAGPVTVTLRSAVGRNPWPRASRPLRRTAKVYLVAKGLGTDVPPETIYQLYLGLPPGSAPRSRQHLTTSVR